MTLDVGGFGALAEDLGERGEGVMLGEGLPTVLGGMPIRPRGAYRTTPEFGADDLEYVSAWLVEGGRQEDMFHRGRPTRSGVRVDEFVAAAGAEGAAFAAEFAAVHAPGEDVHVVPVSNGTHAITLALRAVAAHAEELGLREHRLGANVIVPGLTWPGTAAAALGRYAPRLADVDSGTLTVDPRAVEALVDEDTVAIIAVDLYCRMADRDRLRGLAERRQLALIEDCAQAHGASYGGRVAGAHGHVGTFSFQGSKTLAAGEMGAAMTRSPVLAQRLASLSNCGRPVADSGAVVAGNDRVPGIVAALARGQLVRFPEQAEVRRRAFAVLDRVALHLPGVMPLRDQPVVDRCPTYKWAARYDLTEFRPMSIGQLLAALRADLGCEVSRTYVPLSRCRLYQPHSDPMLALSSAYWQAIEPSQYDLTHAWSAYETVLCVEHAAALDPRFPAAYAEAVTRVRRYAGRIAREVKA